MIRLRIEGRMLERLLARAMEQGAAFRRVTRDGERALTLDTGERGAPWCARCASGIPCRWRRCASPA